MQSCDCFSEWSEKLTGDTVNTRLTRGGGNALRSREHHHTGGILTIPNILLVGRRIGQEEQACRTGAKLVDFVLAPG